MPRNTCHFCDNPVIAKTEKFVKKVLCAECTAKLLKDKAHNFTLGVFTELEQDKK